MHKLLIALVFGLAAVGASAASGVLAGGVAAGIMLTAVIGIVGFLGMRSDRAPGAI